MRLIPVALLLGTLQASAQPIPALDEVNFKVKCEQAARKQLADPPTFQFVRRGTMEVERVQTGLLFWIFHFDGATKKGNLGHFAAACNEQLDGTVKLTVR